MALYLGGVRVSFKVLMFVSLVLQVSVAGLRRRRQEPTPGEIIVNRVRCWESESYLMKVMCAHSNFHVPAHVITGRHYFWTLK